MDKYLLLRLLLYLFELGALISGLVHWKKVKQTYWKWFVVYLLVIVLAELSAEYAGTVLKEVKLNIIINIYFSIPLQFIFIYWLFYQRSDPAKEKRWPLIGAGIYIISLLFESLYLKNNKLAFSSISYLTGNVILLLLVFIFLFSFINSNEILYYKKSMMFWVCLGLLFFYLGTLPFFGLWNTLANNYPNVFNVYWMVEVSLNCLMYFLFSIAFIWGNPK